MERGEHAKQPGYRLQSGHQQPLVAVVRAGQLHRPDGKEGISFEPVRRAAPMPVVDELDVDPFAGPKGHGDFVEKLIGTAQVVRLGGHRVAAVLVHEADASSPLANESRAQHPERVKREEKETRAIRLGVANPLDDGMNRVGDIGVS